MRDGQSNRKQYVKQTTLNNKITKARELFLNGDIDANDYKSIKSENETKINVVEAKISELGTDLIKIKDLEVILNKSLVTLTKLDVMYCKSDSSVQRKIIGSIYPEKFTFENLKDRTANVSEAFNLIYLINSELYANKNGANDQNLILSLWVFLHGLEPRSSEPESDMLPLHHRKIWRTKITKNGVLCKFIEPMRTIRRGFRQLRNIKDPAC